MRNPSLVALKLSSGRAEKFRSISDITKKVCMALNLIYHFQPSQSQEGDFRTANYQVVYFFSEGGFLDNELLSEMAKVIPEGDHQNLKFLSLDDLKSFALRTAQEVQENEVRLLSVQDYNIGLDG